MPTREKGKRTMPRADMFAVPDATSINKTNPKCELVMHSIPTAVKLNPTICAVCAAVLVAGASKSDAEESWDYTGFIYLWGASLGGETVTGQDIDVSFGDILDNLDFGIMGTLEARKGRWAVFGDGIYLSMSDDDTASFGPGISASADASVEGLVLGAGIGYDLLDTDQLRLNGFGKLRYLDLDTTVNISRRGGSRRLSDDFSTLDAVVGVRGAYTISDDWNLVYYGDIGAGDSDLTWQAALAVEHDFDKWTLTFGYRHLAWDDVNESKTVKDVEFSGPFIGAKIKF